MTKEKVGQFTRTSNKVKKMLVNREFVTSDGEVIELDKSVINNMTCDITNVLLEHEERKKVNDTYLYIKKENNSIYNVGGYFYHLLFKNLLDKNFEENYMIRFCKLCTYLNYDNTLVQGKTKRQVKVLEKDLHKVWNLSERELRNTKNYLLINNLIFIDGQGIITVNKKFAIRGKVNGDSSMTRVFINGFNELYDGVTARQHSMLAMFIKVLPYLNTEYNILCENPEETDKRLIKPLKWVELGKRIELTVDQSKKLKYKLFKLRINGKKVIAEWKDDNGVKIVVNPAVFWKANESNISDVAKLFDI